MGLRTLAAVSGVLAASVLAACSATGAASVIRPAARTSQVAPAGLAATAAGSRAPGGSTAFATALAISPGATVSVGVCSAPPAYKALAARLSAGIQGALRGRSGSHAVTVYDAVTKVSCSVNGGGHFDSASIVKTIILAALLRWHQETGTPLSDWEQDEATLMITQSDDDAATALWDEVGMSRLQRFLDLAKMNQTQLGQDGYWGLTQVTAHDEMLLLRLLAQPNPVLSPASRAYELGLMSQVIGAQRWGTPAGAPPGVTVHVKNGWLGDASGWHINSLGVFTGKGKNYLIAVLTGANPSEGYGIGTIENVARVIQRDLNATGR